QYYNDSDRQQNHMKQILLITILTLNFSTIFGQTTTNNSLTSKHQNIVGTKISLIPPKGFLKSVNFLGLQQTQSGSTIMILDIPGPFIEVSKGLTKAGFLSQGVEVKDIENLIINNLPAILVTGEQNAYGNIYTKFVLCFGTDKETIMINGASPNNLKEIAKEIKTSILTSFYEADRKINPFDVVDYEIEVSKSNLFFANSMSNALTFTTDGLFPTKSVDKTSLTIAKSFSKTIIEDKKLFVLNRLKQLPVEITKTETTEEILIDGISGYEIISTSKDKKTGEPEKVYFVILFSDSLYYLFYGSTNQEFDSNIDRLKKAVKTFKRK
ncbi:MAG: hypothetical protein U5L45_05365, partial [Saprospiraceae bacterium]|nr:hypothetical protein [Saprospiraceae bacterium]